MTLLLDIDGVLIGWYGKPTAHSGFSDWKGAEPGQYAVRWTSAEQLALIASTFDVQWHTTWIGPHLENARFVDKFTEWFNFGPYPVLIDQLDTIPGEPQWSQKPSVHDQWLVAPGYTHAVPIDAIPVEVWPALDGANWWKLNAVAALLDAGKLPGKIVWADDELEQEKHYVFQVLRHFDAIDRFRLVAPGSVLTRTQIEEAAEWLKS